MSYFISIRATVIRARTLSLVVLTALLSQGCYPAGQSFNKSATYHGRLLNADTGLPVDNASLKIQSGSLNASTKSDADGYFLLGPLREFRVGIMTMEGLRPYQDSHPWPATFEVSISQSAYQPRQLTVEGIDSLVFEMGDILLQPEHKK